MLTRAQPVASAASSDCVVADPAGQLDRARRACATTPREQRRGWTPGRRPRPGRPGGSTPRRPAARRSAAASGSPYDGLACRPRPGRGGPPGRRRRRRRAARSGAARLHRVSDQLQPVGSSAAPASPDFSGWNWVAHSGAVLDGGDERLAVLGPGQRGACAAAPAQDRDGVGVHEVEPLVASSRRTAPARRAAGRCSSPCAAAPGRPAGRRRRASRRSPSVALAVLDARRRTAPACPTQMPSTGRPPASALGDDLVPADRAQPGHAGGERADAGHDQPVGLAAPVGSRRSRSDVARRPAASGPQRPSGGCRTRSRGRRRSAARGHRSQRRPWC